MKKSILKYKNLQGSSSLSATSPRFSTFWVKPSAFNFQLSTFGFSLSIFRFPPFTFHFLLFASCFLFSTFSFQLHAQQDPNFNQYFFNPLTVNPAYAGSRGTLSAVALHRSQWVGFDGAPTTQAFSIHSPTRNKKMGLGLQLMNDNIGPKNTVSISGVYAYKIRLFKGQLGFGLRASLYNYTFNWDEIEYKDGSAFSANEKGKVSYILPSFDFGMYYSDNKNYLGLEFTHLNQGRMGVQDDNVNINSTVEQSAQAILMAGRAFKLSKLITLKPALLVKAGGRQPAFVDLNASVLLKEKLWLGVSYRYQTSVAAILEYNINKEFRIGYSYDIATTVIRNQNGGSHEIFIGYDLNIFKARIVSPRYF